MPQILRFQDICGIAIFMHHVPRASLLADVSKYKSGGTILGDNYTHHAEAARRQVTRTFITLVM